MKFVTQILVLFLALSPISPAFGKNILEKPDVIVDSAMTLREALAGSKAPRSVLDAQRLITVRYRSLDGKIHEGQLVCHHQRVSAIRRLFRLMLKEGFPVAKCIPIVSYGWSDDASMADNNTSMFNYRFIARSTRLSRHASGVAIDINPRFNPAVYSSGETAPPGARYRPHDIPGTLAIDSPVTRFMVEEGWTWGGTWSHVRDYQHFEKPLKQGTDG